MYEIAGPSSSSGTLQHDARQPREEFLREILRSENRKSTHFNVLPHDKYLELISQVEEAEKMEVKTALQQRRLKRFGVVNIGGVKKLIARNDEDNIRYYLAADELYDVIDGAHMAIGHGGRDKMLVETSKNYANITREMLSLYLSMCPVCQQKKIQKKRGLDSSSDQILHSEIINSRCQVDFIDFQTQPDGKFSFIMIYQDFQTKFILLRALESKNPAEVAYYLNDIFLTIGAPCILQSADNGKEFVVHVIRELARLWPQLKIIPGKRHQVSIERLNQDIENMIKSWLIENKSTKWSEGLRYVQFMRNRTLHSGIKQSPYKAMFGVEPKVGLSSASLPTQILNRIQDEDDLRKVIEMGNDTNLIGNVATKLENIGDNDNAFIRSSIQETRHQFTAEDFVQHAKKMKNHMADMSIPELFCRPEFDLYTQHFLQEGEVGSVGIAQGSSRCSCIKNCSTNKCQCKKKMIRCNAKCHQSTSCKNK